MQRERQDRDDFFGIGDPFGRFRGFGMMRSLFGGRDPFDDPFFARPFGTMFEPSGFNLPASSSGEALKTDRAKPVVIEELLSDDEGEPEEVPIGDKNSDYQKYIGSSKEPSVEHPDDYPDERENKIVDYQSDYDKNDGKIPQARCYSFQSSKVTYGGIGGAYYTTTRTRRQGNDGVVVEEKKEADKTTGQATHRISRGIHDKGHSVTRKLNSDGKVDTVQTLHNLNEDELAGFEEVWRDDIKGLLPGWNDHYDLHGTTGSGGSGQNRMKTRGGWAFPSIEHAWNATGREIEPHERTKKVVRINIE